MPNEGYEVVGTPSGSNGEMIFADMSPGTYTVEASAPGFLAVRKRTEIEPGSHLQTLFLIMKPRPLPATAVAPAVPVPAVAPAAAANPNRTPWIPPGIDDIVPAVEAGVECPRAQVITGAGQRMKELVENLQKFSATERVEHFNVDAAGSRGKPEARTFDYVVVLTLSNADVFQLDEYRNGRVDPSQFPAQFATTGLPGMALIFHPTMASDFNFTCEGLGHRDGHPAWQVHFALRADRPNRIRAYVIAQHEYPVPLKGRAWIDAGTYQVRRLESDLMKPIQEIALTQEHMAIDYGSVQFQTHKQQLWLPLDAEVYWERRGHRFYRRHTFSDFKVFEVESAQQIQAPKESYCFTNTSARDIAGILTVSPVSGIPAGAVSIQFTIPPGRSVCKLVGPGKDVSMPVDQVGSATFKHNGLAGWITADANLVKESTLDLIPESDIAAFKP
jgi:hypothetical protein